MCGRAAPAGAGQRGRCEGACSRRCPRGGRRKAWPPPSLGRSPTPGGGKTPHSSSRVRPLFSGQQGLRREKATDENVLPRPPGGPEGAGMSATTWEVAGSSAG